VKIILREYLENLGDKDDVVSVSDGYARNYLIPRGLAVRADSAEMKQLENRRKFAARREKRVEQKLGKMVGDFEGTEIVIEANVSSEGKLYGSVSDLHIAKALSEKFDIAIDKSRVDLEQAIKFVGDYTVTVSLGDGREAEIAVKVIGVGGEAEAIGGEPGEEPEEAVEETKAAEAETVAEEAEVPEEAPAEEVVEEAPQEAEEETKEAPEAEEKPAEEPAEDTAEEEEPAAEEQADEQPPEEAEEEASEPEGEEEKKE